MSLKSSKHCEVRRGNSIFKHTQYFIQSCGRRDNNKGNLYHCVLNHNKNVCIQLKLYKCTASESFKNSRQARTMGCVYIDPKRNPILPEKFKVIFRLEIFFLPKTYPIINDFLFYNPKGTKRTTVKILHYWLWSLNIIFLSQSERVKISILSLSGRPAAGMPCRTLEVRSPWCLLPGTETGKLDAPCG